MSMPDNQSESEAIDQWIRQPSVIHQPLGGKGADLPWLLSTTAQIQPSLRASSLPGFGLSLMQVPKLHLHI